MIKFIKKNAAPIITATFLILITTLGILKAVENKNNSISQNYSESPLGQLIGKGGDNDYQNQAQPTPTPTPLPKGVVKGKIKAGYYSKVLADVEIKLISEQNSFDTKTDIKGDFNINNVPADTYKITASHANYIFPSQDFTLEDDQEYIWDKALGTLKNPQPTLINVIPFNDANGNETKDDNESSVIANFYVDKKVSGTYEKKYSFTTKENSSYAFKLEELGEYRIRVLPYTFFAPPAKSETLVTVDGYGGAQKDFYYAMKPTNAQSKVTMFVFNDKNENAYKDPDEEFINYQYVQLKNNNTGKSFNYGVGYDGSVQKFLEFGEYTATVIPEDKSWDYYYKITKKTENFKIEPTSKDIIIHLGAKKLY